VTESELARLCKGTSRRARLLKKDQELKEACRNASGMEIGLYLTTVAKIIATLYSQRYRYCLYFYLFLCNLNMHNYSRCELGSVVIWVQIIGHYIPLPVSLPFILNMFVLKILILI
jgi:hypothetical protein